MRNGPEQTACALAWRCLHALTFRELRATDADGVEEKQHFVWCKQDHWPHWPAASQVTGGGLWGCKGSNIHTL